MAGRCAEKAVQEDFEGQTLGNTFDMPRQVSKGSLRRSQEDRLKIMLHLATPAADDDRLMIRQSQLYSLPKDFMSSFFQPDVPLMWKRAWDDPRSSVILNNRVVVIQTTTKMTNRRLGKQLRP
jgi:hypothetical protein